MTKVVAPIFKGYVQQGKLTLNDQDGFRKYLTNLVGEVDLVVKKAKKLRSDGQNRYGYGVALKMLAEYTGYTVGQIKELAKKELGLVEYKQSPSGGMVEITRSSATFTTTEFEDYMRLLRQWGDELGIYIPLPREGEPI